jgi:hypothetical protein
VNRGQLGEIDDRSHDRPHRVPLPLPPRQSNVCSPRAPVDREIRKLIREMSSADPLWGAPRIHGELLKLGIEISQATVAKYMVRRPGTPSPTWRSFLRNQAAGIAAIDMFVVASASFRLFYVMIILAPIAGGSFTRPSPSIPPHLGSPAR